MASTHSDCLFCKIVAGSIPAKREYEDSDVLAFADIGPKAPAHFLIIPKKHIASLAETVEEDTPLLGKLMAAATDLAQTKGLSGGYRVVVNTGDDGGQTVHHLHLHLLGGRQMTWPPG